MLTTTIPLKGRAYNNFADSINNKKTRLEYTRFLVYYCYWKKIKSFEDLLKGDSAQIKEDIKDYLKYLKEERGLAAGSRSGATAAIKHFYSMNDIELNWYQISKFIGKDDTIAQDRPYTHEQIAKVLSVCDLKYRAIVLLMCSSAARVGAIHELQYRDLVKMKGHNIFKVIVYRATREEYYSFTTPEAYKAVNDYLSFRERSGEIFTDKSPLFRLDFDPLDIEQVKNAKPLSLHSIKSRIRKLLIKANVVTEQKYSEENQIGRRRNDVRMSHGFRKFAATEMGRARINIEIREFLLGHKQGVRDAYQKYSEEDRLNEYLRAVDNLTIDASNRLQMQVDDYKKQERELKELNLKLREVEMNSIANIGILRKFLIEVAEISPKNERIIEKVNEYYDKFWDQSIDSAEKQRFREKLRPGQEEAEKRSGRWVE